MYAISESEKTTNFNGSGSVSASHRLSDGDGFERGTIRRLEAKEHVFCDGVPRTHVFRIEEGVIALSKILSDGRRQIIDFAYPGDYVGLGLFGDHVFDAQATCPTKVKCLLSSHLEREAAHDPALAIRLYNAVSAELSAARRLLVSVGQGTAMERIAMFLVELRGRSEATDADYIKLPMRRSEIADFLGLTIETVSRTLTKLRTMGVISIENGTDVRILDADRLIELAD